MLLCCASIWHVIKASARPTSTQIPRLKRCAQPIELNRSAYFGPIQLILPRARNRLVVTPSAVNGDGVMRILPATPNPAGLTGRHFFIRPAFTVKRFRIRSTPRNETLGV